MRLTPIRGRDQRGFAFVNSGATIARSKVHRVKYAERTVFCDVRQSDIVPRDVLVLDSRLFDELGCLESESVELDSIDIAIPKCRGLSLSIEPLHGTAAARVVESSTVKVEDLREPLDSLIIKPGQRFSLPEMGISLIVVSASPLSGEDGACRISSDSFAGAKLSSLIPSSGFNLVCLLEFGLRGIGRSGVKNASGAESGLQLVAEMIRLLGEAGPKSLFAVVVYSTDTSAFVTFDSVTGEETILSESASETDMGVLTSWLEQQTPRHTGKPIRPAVGLERAISLAKEASVRNGMRTVIVLFTRGTYSAGGNPVAMAAKSSAEPWKVFCIPLPGSRDLELIRAIAEAGGGKMLELNKAEDMHILIDAIQSSFGGVSK